MANDESPVRRGPLPPGLFLAAIVVQTGLHLLLPIGKLIPEPWSWAGVVLVVAGLVLNLVADRAFKRAQTAVNPFDTPTALVADGVFRFSRHPMYLGMIAILAGAAILWGTVGPWLVLPPFGWILVRFIRLEEEAMEKEFGEEYRAYAERVRRWL